MKTILITGANANNEVAIQTIKSLESNGCNVVCVPENNENMKKSDLAGLFALAMMGESMLHSSSKDNDLYEPSLNPVLKIQKKKKIPKGCKLFKIGKYEIVSINRKNAIRKALKLRSSDFNCC